MFISVIICTHNPRPDYLRRVLDALQAQTLPKDQWELLLVDNASKEALAPAWDLSWHPHSHHIREDELGLTHARLRGIKESQGELLVFVDDDTVLAVDYLSTTLELIRSHPWVGALSGNNVGEFEIQPESWVEVMFEHLSIVEVKNEAWGCLPGTKALGFAPWGAGMVIRKTVTVYYAELAANDPLRRGLGRKGTSLASAEDSDMALCACTLGFAIGRFPQLRLTHLIPAARLERNYLLRLMEEKAVSHTILGFIWDGFLPGMNEDKPCRSERLFRFYKTMRNRLRGGIKTSFEDELRRAHDRGVLKAIQILQPQQTASAGVTNPQKNLLSPGDG